MPIDPDFDAIAPKPTRSAGFRMVHLLLIVAILAVLIALLLPATRSARGPARRAQCINNLRQIGLALRNYEAEHGALPPARTFDAQGRPAHSWRTLILPYLEEHRLYRRIDLTKPWNDPANAGALKSMPSVFRCPGSDAPEGTTVYLASVGPRACLAVDAPRRLADITRAHDRSLMVLEVAPRAAVPWMSPVDADEATVLGVDAKTEFSHPGGANFLFVDGSARWLGADLPTDERRALISIDAEPGRAPGQARDPGDRD